MEVADEYVASLLADEALEKQKAAAVRGPTAYLRLSSLPARTPPLPRINKTYLSNTISHTEAHNRREEEDACYRQHKLQKRRLDEVAKPNTGGDDDDYHQERNFWALKKLRTVGGESEEKSSSASVSSQDSKHRKSGRKSKKPKKMKKKKKRKKDKKARKEEKVRGEEQDD